MSLEDKRIIHPTNVGYLVFCPGCRHAHHLFTVPRPGLPCWEFNNDQESPTFKPSLLISTTEQTDEDGTVWPAERCHSFITAGSIRFLSDCTHELAGQTVALAPFP